MKIAISGASGFVGTHLTAALTRHGHRVVPMSRGDFARGLPHLAETIDGCEVVINLAGAPINRRWSTSYKRTLVSSRIETTRMLVQAMSRLQHPPHSFISTSAIGAFNDAGLYSEEHAPNATDFLGRLAVDWEAAARQAETLGIRTLIFRFALVLGADGGLLKQLLPPFRLGLGGPIGDGRQAFSWVHIDDLVDAYLVALKLSSMQGVFHIAAPKPATNMAFTKTLGAALHRPTLFPLPPLLLRLVFGEAADVMTGGQRVISKRLPELGFQFRYSELELAIDDLVHRPSRSPVQPSLANSDSQ
ncbi:MAG: TIGR01777 family oxidoreductase [Candidatus Thiodiazotropha sp.]